MHRAQTQASCRTQAPRAVDERRRGGVEPPAGPRRCLRPTSPRRTRHGEPHAGSRPACQRRERVASTSRCGAARRGGADARSALEVARRCRPREDAHHEARTTGDQHEHELGTPVACLKVEAGHMEDVREPPAKRREEESGQTICGAEDSGGCWKRCCSVRQATATRDPSDLHARPSGRRARTT